MQVSIPSQSAMVLDLTPVLQVKRTLRWSALLHMLPWDMNPHSTMLHICWVRCVRITW